MRTLTISLKSRSLLVNSECATEEVPTSVAPLDAFAVLTTLRHEAMPRREEYAAFLETDERFKIELVAMAEQLHD